MSVISSIQGDITMVEFAIGGVVALFLHEGAHYAVAQHYNAERSFQAIRATVGWMKYLPVAGFAIEVFPERLTERQKTLAYLAPLVFTPPALALLFTDYHILKTTFGFAAGLTLASDIPMLLGAEIDPENIEAIDLYVFEEVTNSER